MDAIGKIGIPSLQGSSQKIAMGTTVALSALSLILYIVGCAGWSTGSSLQSANWTIVSETVTVTVGTVKTSQSFSAYFGLQSTYAVSNSGGTSTSQLYSSCASASTECSSCQTSGQAAFGLSLFSLLLTLCLIVVCFMRVFKDSALAKVAGILLSFLALIFSIAAYGTFNENCFKNIQSSITSVSGLSASVTQGPGFGSIVACSVFMFFTLVLMVATPTAPPENISLDAPPAAAGSAEGTGGGKVVVFDDD